MKEERLIILSMLEEGKINVEEATKLLEALEELGEPKSNDNIKYNSKDSSEERYKKLTNKTLEEIGSDIGSAVSHMISGLKDIGNSIGFNINSETITTDLQEDIGHIENPILDFKAVNGSIILNQTSSDSLSIKVSCQYKNGLLDDNKDFYKFYIEENKIVFAPIYNRDLSIKLDVFLPNKMYDQIILNTTNGKIDIQGINQDTLSCITTNGSINISLINSKEINLSSSNGKIECKDINSINIKACTTNTSISLIDVTSTNISAHTSNAKISLSHINTEKIVCKTTSATIEAIDISSKILDLTTSNAKIICNGIDIKKIMDIRLITSNGSISTELNTLEKDAYFNLETSMGNINFNIPNMVYEINNIMNLGNKKIVAHSINFDEGKDVLRYFASTSNGSIKVN